MAKKTYKKSLSKPSDFKHKRKKAYKKGLISRNTDMSYATDKERKALAPGKRVSKSGNIYYEGRKNRADINRKKRPHLKMGGDIFRNY